MRNAWRTGLWAVLWAYVLIALGAVDRAEGRTIVLGFDGMDPKLAERWMAEGALPNFSRLREQGHYQTLATTNPPQSPVAWATFATGLNPGAHGIFDFVHRDPETYGPQYSITEVLPPKSSVSLFGWQIPLGDGITRTKRSGTAFWTTAEREGRHASVLRVPATYPADPITRMLSGMGVPDLIGSQGTFTIYTTEPAPKLSGEGATNARIVHVQAQGGRIETQFNGPMHPLQKNPQPLTVPLQIEDLKNKRVRVQIDGHVVEIAEGRWSDWQTLRFSFAGLMGVSGTVRLLLVESFPNLHLYVSPIQIDPRDPVAPIASPAGYSKELAKRIGLFHTIGMPEETWSLNEGQISDAEYLAMIRTTLAEGEAMFFDTLARHDSDLVVNVFVQTDRVSHMFWRGIDPKHPLHDKVDAQGRNAIHWIYGEADRILGRTLAQMGPDDRLIVLSDHGFAGFRRGVNLNRWLVEQGYMALKPGQPTSESLLTNVDWVRTKAYAIGLNSLFLNVRGRESLGVVRPEEMAALKSEIQEKLQTLVDPLDGTQAVLQVHDGSLVYEHSHQPAAPDLVVGYNDGYRASWETALGGVPAALIEDNGKKWSGDHLIQPALVPGVLFTSFKPDRDVTSIGDLPRLIEGTLGLKGHAVAERVAPSRGIFDIAAPVLGGIDRHVLSWLPAFLRIILWGLLASWASMAMYRRLSNQKRMGEIKSEVLKSRVQLNAFDGELNEMWPLLGRNLSLACRQLGLTFMPAVVASLPVVLILLGLSSVYDGLPPQPGEKIRVTAVADVAHQLPPLRWEGAKAEPTEAKGVWDIAWPSNGESARLVDSDGITLVSLPGAAPASTIHQKRWWNKLTGNPAGYLPSPGDVDAVTFGLRDLEFLPFGPAWLRSWLALFFVVVLSLSLFLKFRWRLH